MFWVCFCFFGGSGGGGYPEGGRARGHRNAVFLIYKLSTLFETWQKCRSPPEHVTKGPKNPFFRALRNPVLVKRATLGTSTCCIRKIFLFRSSNAEVGRDMAEPDCPRPPPCTPALPSCPALVGVLTQARDWWVSPKPSTR